MYGYIYLTTNIINGKIYIGQHIAEQFEPAKYIGSGLILLKALNKYGKNSFKNELLCTCDSQEELNEKEKFYISQYQAVNPKIGYNVSAGGDINNIGTITINNGIKEKHILPKYLEYYITLGYAVGRNMSTYVNGMVGRQQSAKQKHAVSKACSYKRTDKQKRNFSEAKKAPNKFICLRTPDNKSTIRCLLKNKDHYLALNYLECKN